MKKTLITYHSSLIRLILIIMSHISYLITFSQSVTPFLTLNTDMHTAAIRSISTDSQGKYILTCSDDKTAKLWNASDGSIIRTYRVPIGEGYIGWLYACAISPDGKTAAVGGFDQRIYLFNTQSGALIQLLSDMSVGICDLEFSPDGRYLAAALQLQSGVNIYQRVSTGEFNLIKHLTGYGDASYNIAFDLNGRLATVCFDGKLRLYDAGFSLIRERQMQEGTQPVSIAFSYNGSLLAVGYVDSPNLEVLDAISLNTLYRPDVSGTDNINKLESVSFSADGKYLYAGGEFGSEDKNGILLSKIRRWDDAGKGKFVDITACANSILDIKPLPDNAMIFCGYYPDFGRLSTNGTIEFYKAGEINTFTSSDKSHFTISTNGSAVGFTSYGKSALVFSVNETKLLTSDSEIQLTGNKLYPCTDSTNDIKISDWNHNFSPKINGKALSFLREKEMCWSVDIERDGKHIVFGTAWSLYCTNDAGDLEWNEAVPSTAAAVNISGNGKTVAAALSNGMINWYRMSDGKLLLTLFAHPDNKRWILFTPSGYYDCSHGAETLIGWHINNLKPSKVVISQIANNMPGEKAGLLTGDTILAIGNIKIETKEQAIEVFAEKAKLDSFKVTIKRAEKILHINIIPVWDELAQKRRIGISYTTGFDWVKESSYYPADRFFETYYRPDLVQEIFKNYETDEEILKRWGDKANAVQNMKKPPLVKIVSPAVNSVNNSAIGRESVTVTVEITDQGGGIDEILLFQNGKLVETTQRGFKPLEETGKKRTKTYQLNLSSGENKIKASAFSTDRIESNPDEITLNYAGAEKSATMYMLVLGINNYKNSIYNLNYARADAQSIRQALLGGSTSIFKDVKVLELYDEQATRSNIESKINEIAGLAGQNDMFVFFYAGHGTMSEQQENQPSVFYLIPTDVTKMFGDNEILKNLAVSAFEIREWCKNIKAQKQLIMMDACQSGGVVEAFAMRTAAEEKAILQLARSAGVAVMSSTGTDQYAAEFTQIGHGVFTYALLDGLSGNADGGTKDKKITVKELEAYINDLIPELTKKYRGQAQYPNSYSSGMDFPVILVK
ncbi:MAG: caspase family protein [Bacteroidia bacterium]|nr:caspase family protein [Bacteroidia bacterium]